jgi:hypothetical protein
MMVLAFVMAVLAVICSRGRSVKGWICAIIPGLFLASYVWLLLYPR